MRRTLLLTVVLAACNQASPAVTVERSGVSLTDQQVSVGAELRTTASVRAITIEITFRDASGTTVGTRNDSLPSCSSRCYWGGTFVGDQIGPAWRTITGVALDVHGEPSGEDGGGQDLTVARAGDGAITGVAPAQGIVFAVVQHDGRLIAGASMKVDDGEPFHIPADLIPSSNGDQAMASFYEGTQPGE